ncbi:MAG TPA: acyl carrier protein [Firmicutes bacterium]|nr:acyl carrier protein [Bacillota bacterium]
MAVDDQLVVLLAQFIHADENALSLDDALWSHEGGLLEADRISDLIDEIEGEFNIRVHPSELENLDTVADLINHIQAQVHDTNGNLHQ